MCLQEHSGFVTTDRLTSYSSVELEKSGHESRIYSTHGQIGSEVGQAPGMWNWSLHQ